MAKSLQVTVTNPDDLNTLQGELVTQNYNLEILGLKNPADFRKFSKSLMMLDRILKETNDKVDNGLNKKLNKGSYEGDADDLKREIDGKEPAFSKKSGFNLDKSDSVSSNSSNVLATSLAVKTSYDKASNAERIANTKEPAISKKTGFNLDKSDRIDLDDSNTLATAKGLNSLRKKVDSICPYNVGDIYITTKSGNPSSTWLGTTWDRIEGRFLFATSGGEGAGTTGGSNSKTLSIANLPSHNHSASQSAHSHTQPAHTHKYNTFGIGSSRLAVIDSYNNGGTTSTTSAGGENTGAAQPPISVGHTGNGAAFDVRPAYYTVHVWKRRG